MEEKCDTYEAKGILGYRSEKTYAVAAKNKRETRQEQREWEHK